jgi:hypothetical protein
MSFSCR